MADRRSYENRFESVTRKIKILPSLRKVVSLHPECDISERQWSVLEPRLSAIADRCLSRLKKEGRRYLADIHNPRSARALNELLGEMELELSKDFTFFDTFLDLLTQRHSSELGKPLAGCDILAWDAIRKDHPALRIVEPPLVYCDRGFGASILREGVMFPDGIPNPMPVIQIPYSRLEEKYNLTSVLHEIGHEAMGRLGLVTALPKAIRETLAAAGAPTTITDLFALWTSELGPDFWTFCSSGMAQASSIKEILSLPSRIVLRFSWTDPHPPPYLRVLLSFEWCRQFWGSGRWDTWEKEWLGLYPVDAASIGMRRILRFGKKYLPIVSRAFSSTRFRALGGKGISDLFDLSAVAPWVIDRISKSADSGILNLKGLSPCAQLAVFRYLRDTGKFSEATLDKMMTEWLSKLGERRRYAY